ncbi:MAG: hypothetical protein ACREV9_05715 [Burkholderiales bacterium]
MCYEWYEESLLDAAIWQSKEKAEKKMAEHAEPPPAPKKPVEEPVAA